MESRLEGFRIEVSQSQQRARTNGVYLLFAKGKRPSRDAIKRFADGNHHTSLSYDPLVHSPLRSVDDDFDGASPTQNHFADSGKEMMGWVELLRDGLAFDLEGLAPGYDLDIPEIEYNYDFEDKLPLVGYEALRLVPGSHLIGGGNTLPIIRSIISLACDLAHEIEDISAIAWPPARSVIGRIFFESISTAWLDGGAFPALGLTSFKQMTDGAIQSVGLDYLIGQELRIEVPLSNQRIEATRLGIRLVNHLILVGGLTESERFTAPDGSMLVLRPSRNGKFIRAWGD